MSGPTKDGPLRAAATSDATYWAEALKTVVVLAPGGNGAPYSPPTTFKEPESQQEPSPGLPNKFGELTTAQQADLLVSAFKLKKIFPRHLEVMFDWRGAVEQALIFLEWSKERSASPTDDHTSPTDNHRFVVGHYWSNKHHARGGLKISEILELLNPNYIWERLNLDPQEVLDQHNRWLRAHAETVRQWQDNGIIKGAPLGVGQTEQSLNYLLGRISAILQDDWQTTWFDHLTGLNQEVVCEYEGLLRVIEKKYVFCRGEPGDNLDPVGNSGAQFGTRLNVLHLEQQGVGKLVKKEQGGDLTPAEYGFSWNCSLDPSLIVLLKDPQTTTGQLEKFTTQQLIAAGAVRHSGANVERLRWLHKEKGINLVVPKGMFLKDKYPSGQRGAQWRAEVGFPLLNAVYGESSELPPDQANNSGDSSGSSVDFNQLVGAIVERGDQFVTVPNFFSPPESVTPHDPDTSIALLGMYKDLYPNVLSNRLIFFAAVEAGNKPALEWLLVNVKSFSEMSPVDQQIMLSISVRHLFSAEGGDPEVSIFKMLVDSLDAESRGQVLNLRVRGEAVQFIGEQAVTESRYLQHMRSHIYEHTLWVSFNSLQGDNAQFPNGDPSMLHPYILADDKKRIRRDLEIWSQAPIGAWSYPEIPPKMHVYCAGETIAESFGMCCIWRRSLPEKALRYLLDIGVDILGVNHQEEFVRANSGAPTDGTEDASRRKDCPMGLFQLLSGYYDDKLPYEQHFTPNSEARASQLLKILDLVPDDISKVARPEHWRELAKKLNNQDNDPARELLERVNQVIKALPEATA